MNDLNFYYLEHTTPPHAWLLELYGLRKKVFADRLSWKVNVRNGIELDEYDTDQTVYIVGTRNGLPLASLRLINTLKPYMLEGPFQDFFDYKPPKNCLIAESSRFFVDKIRSRALGLANMPLTEMLLLSMHNYAVSVGVKSIITVVSRAMARIVRTAGWQYNILASGETSEGEKLLLLDMPVTCQNHQQLLVGITKKFPIPYAEISHWPLPVVVN
uniref:Acyl-homoserine-lactone synthase n=1 Tax=uncultured proteobacterium QS1 TaxID=288647 RepID=Q6B348_9PROT|nr:AHL synthase [uncultured proteobacterium QS1]